MTQLDLSPRRDTFRSYGVTAQRSPQAQTGQGGPLLTAEPVVLRLALVPASSAEPAVLSPARVPASSAGAAVTAARAANPCRPEQRDACAPVLTSGGSGPQGEVETGSVPAGSLRQRLRRHWEAVKFLAVGGVCFVITVAINYALKLTVLTAKPVAALTIAIVIATFVSYLLNREWSFRTRGGRKPLHEAALFFGISGIGVVINDLPMWAARYLLQLRVPEVSQATQEISDLVSGILLGTLLATAFRLWAFRKWAFPHENARPHPASAQRR